MKKYYYEVLVYDGMPKKSLVELAEGMECWKGVCKVTILEEDPAALRARVEALEAVLQFAVNNKANFAEHDPDGVKRAWIERAASLVA